MKKNLFLNFTLKYYFFYKLYLYYNLYIRNFKYLFQKSYSQFNEDIFLKKYFSKNNGFYIDIGCHHPTKFNNTYLLYKSGWHGLNIDLSKISIDLFNVFRPRDININSAISDTKKRINFYIPNNNLLSPEITIDKKFKEKLAKHHKNLYNTFITYTTTFEKIKNRFIKNIKSIDLLKIDIEGLDFKVLKTINLQNLSPELIMIEAPSFDKKIRSKIIRYLKYHNYKLIFKNNLNIICKSECSKTF